MKAPSGYNLQSTSFVVVTDEKLRKQIAELMPSEATETPTATMIKSGRCSIFPQGKQ